MLNHNNNYSGNSGTNPLGLDRAGEEEVKRINGGTCDESRLAVCCSSGTFCMWIFSTSAETTETARAATTDQKSIIMSMANTMSMIRVCIIICVVDIL